jgi:prepilin-type N-terminal cleavage/methylation domain-containing protein
MLEKREEGFTLVELLIVVAIIAILAAIAIPQFTKYRLRSFKTEADSDSKNIYTAAQAYLIDHPSETVDSLAKLKTGGFQKSPNISFVDGSMSLALGNIEIYHTTLKTQTKDNNSVIFYNGKINFPNAPD